MKVEPEESYVISVCAPNLIVIEHVFVVADGTRVKGHSYVTGCCVGNDSRGLMNCRDISVHTQVRQQIRAGVVGPDMTLNLGLCDSKKHLKYLSVQHPPNERFCTLIYFETLWWFYFLAVNSSVLVERMLF